MTGGVDDVAAELWLSAKDEKIECLPKRSAEARFISRLAEFALAVLGQTHPLISSNNADADR